jgi:protoheme IX farnesyltransferase
MNSKGQTASISAPAVSAGEVSDFLALLKPRVMFLVVFTALVGMVVVHPTIHPVIAFASLLMIAIGAGASGALNMWWDADIDARMTRTARPSDSDRAHRARRGAGLRGRAVGRLGRGARAHRQPARRLRLAFTIAFYVVVYSMWLKRTTAQNIVIGGAAGAFPPMVGEAAVTGTVGVETFVLFLIIFLWTPPHFWALALVKSGDYARAGIPMMPNVAGPDSTRRQILAYTLLLVPADSPRSRSASAASPTSRSRGSAAWPCWRPPSRCFACATASPPRRRRSSSLASRSCTCSPSSPRCSPNTASGCGGRSGSRVMAPPDPNVPTLTAEEARRRRSRSIAIAVSLAAMALLFYAVTIAKLGPGVLNRAM